MLSLWDVLSDEQITPQVLSGSLFPHTLWIVCLPSLQELHSALWALTQPSPLILKTPGIKPQKFQEIMKFGPSHFSRQLLGGGGGVFIFPCTPCVLVCLLPFSVTMAPSPW